ncbi:related to KOG1 - Subunit of TORC1, a rapamycin-sensitive complex involved in growth control [Pseudozyma flocculosa]|uniref:Related to KOG1 - Subunit of TORC1, a rapamycin-sensitive complex involved in growth control n=1 Tax=Pseudozyma flocculosa TaxID=84751 RepID=A0A5C3FD23_9BASI|nr:related to KOG1 - Subunit of TORC1, a rapamycin-sensitive complex involved in growth control [Pseudozyma flocculosa]
MDDWVLLEASYMSHWGHKRHITAGNPKPRDERDLPDWRMRERLRTVTAALVMCLNIGVDPPDVSKTNPCSKLICWMDPSSLEVSKALTAIGRNLQAQFETLSTKTRYKQCLDPIVEDTKRFCTQLRRTAKDERILFYYNGFGVPKPTPGGEIWVFNRAYTQYIPVTLYDLQTWLGSPCIFVWDASAAGNVVVNFKRLAERRAEEEGSRTGRDGGAGGGSARERSSGAEASGSSSAAGAAGTGTGSKPEEPHFPLRESIHLAACGPDETLPMNPDLPADLFTCCLTSPIEISLRWFVLQNPLPSKLNLDMVMNIPGRLQDRRTPLGELNWIFTAITDTIAWTVLPRTIFRRLFRDDLMVAALLRNFLLADRIMRFYHCTPMSHPKLPATHNHPLWDSWDLAVDQCLAQLPTLLAKERAVAEAAEGGPPVPPHLASFEYRHSTFFSEQLKAFEVWLQQGGVSRKGRRRRVNASVTPHGNPAAGFSSAASMGADPAAFDEDGEVWPVRDPPDQLPIVLQVLLSQVHRLRALILLSQFLDLGPWAVNLALSIGIFPYVLKLLQSPAADLRPVLIYIWARILAVDRSCQNDLLRDNGFFYFTSVLSPFQNGGAGGAGGGSGPTGGAAASSGQALPIPNVSEHRAMCAFILSVFCQDFPSGQAACLETDAMHSCLEHLEDDDFLLRQWSALCLAQLWDDSDIGKAKGIALDAHGKLCCLLGDASPEVRSAVVYALGVLLGASASSQNQVDTISATTGETINVGSGSGGKGGAYLPRRVCPGTGAATGLPGSKQRGLEIGIAIAMLTTKGDCSPLVRKELVIALSPVVFEYKGFFVLAAYLYYSREEAKQKAKREAGAGAGGPQPPSPVKDRFAPLHVHARSRRNSASRTPGADDEADRLEAEEALLARVASKLVIEEELDEEDIANIPAFMTIFVALLDLSVDCHPEVANLACTVIDFVVAMLLESEVATAAESIMRRFGGLDATNRYVTPTNTNVSSEGYFPLTPRAGVAVSTPGSIEEAPLSAGMANGHYGSATSPYGANSQPHSRQQHGSHPSRNGASGPPKRSTSAFTQAVKTIATLGYSRPSSPVNAEHDGAPRHPHHPHGDISPTGNPPPGPAVLAPRRNAGSLALPSQYTSPYGPRYAGPNTPGSENSPSAISMPPSPTSTTAKLAHRSASAESLAHIATRQERRKSAGTTNSFGLGGASSAAGGDGDSLNGSMNGSRGGTGTGTANTSAGGLEHVKVADALAALIALDLQRFQSRFLQQLDGNNGLMSAGSTPMPSPSASRGGRWTAPSTPGSSGLTTPASGFAPNVDLRETLPLKSRLFAWCSEYYTEPQMKAAESEEPGSVKYNVQSWKRQRNERLVADTQAQAEDACFLRNGSVPYLMLFHQFEDHLVTASDQNTINVWDWEEKRLLSRFANGNPARTNITSALFVNEEADAMLLVGSAEGDVRIYRHYDSPAFTPGYRGPELASSFRALPDLVRSKRPSGLIVDWLQVSGHLLAGGDSRVIRVWDAHRELCVCDIPTRASSCVTSLSSETDIGHMFVAGFGDGTVGVYDRRNPPEASLVRLWEEHQTWVQNVHLQKRGNRELVTASVDGEVRLWDIRGRSSISQLSMGRRLGGKLSCMSVHERMPIFAAASSPRPLRPAVSPQNVILTHLESMETLGKPIVRTFAPTGSTSHLGSSSLHAGSSGHGHGHGSHHHHHHHHHHHASHHGASSHHGAGHAAGGYGSLHGGAGASNNLLLPPASETDPSQFTPATGAIAFHPHLPMVAFGGPDNLIEMRRWSP